MAPPDVAKLREEFQGPHELVRTSDGKILFLRHWVGAGGTDLALLLLHGITAYSEPYGKLMAEDLARAGFEVFGLDLRGHGRSDGIRGDLPSGERLSMDLRETIDVLRNRYSRVVLIGHSLGVVYAMLAVDRFPRGIDGVVLLSGGRRIRPGVYRKPTARAAFRNLMAVALFRSRTWIEYSRQGMLGRDDPLCNFHYSVRFYSSVYGLKPWAIARMLRAGVIDSPYLTPTNSLEIPVLIGVGDQDELFTVDSSRELFDRLGAGRKAFLVIPGGHHASFPPGSWGPVVEWLRGQFGTQPVAASGPVPTPPGRIASPSAGTL